ncbi:hypothetical protein NZD89_22455 [Alicyclobacillus fastidiosus]|uniref:Methyl-accepting chemotaxis protein n=1 Tax=Alicyclobacillus fastidiosus TaxID=392011 RepID=A0ABY6ZE62_9BACL|nr:hypothetical protein [Alicyclobacillus fastidiosus]WAH41020.1 hypothetical protein NZD89_22455 [Alicyclobacillus fastidiosus]GMA62542.1 hypothetical protein GCM10025859_29820 [Alicyclobacillus fastidiosus]
MKLSWMGMVKVAIPVLVIALGVNGLVDVRLQRDMAAKTTKLTQQVREAKALSAQLHGGLRGLPTLKSETVEMQSSLVSVQGAAANMAAGLSTLATTVAGIHQTVTAIHTGVQASNQQINAIQTSETHILATLQQLSAVNNQIVEQLGSMVSDEQQIDANLTQMNEKTAVLPSH